MSARASAFVSSLFRTIARSSADANPSAAVPAPVPAAPARAAVPAPPPVEAPPPKAPPVKIQAGPAPAPKALPPRKFSPERDAVIRALYPAEPDRAEIIARVNACPGPRIEWMQIMQRARDLRVRRPHDLAVAARIVGRRAEIAERAAARRPPPPAGVPDEAAIAAHIAARGVTRLPAAAVGETTATIPEADRAAIRAHGDPVRAAMEADHARRMQNIADARRTRRAALIV